MVGVGTWLTWFGTPQTERTIVTVAVLKGSLLWTTEMIGGRPSPMVCHQSVLFFFSGMLTTNFLQSHWHFRCTYHHFSQKTSSWERCSVVRTSARSWCWILHLDFGVPASMNTAWGTSYSFLNFQNRWTLTSPYVRKNYLITHTKYINKSKQSVEPAPFGSTGKVTEMFF